MPRSRVLIAALVGLAAAGVAVLALAGGRGGSPAVAVPVVTPLAPVPSGSSAPSGPSLPAGSPTSSDGAAEPANDIPVATPGPSLPASPGSGSSSDPDWSQVVADLDRLRAKALVAADLGLLAAAVAPGSPAWESDRARVESLAARGWHPRKLRTAIYSVDLLRGAWPSPAASPTRAGQPARGEPQEALDRGSGVTLLVRDQRRAYDLVDRTGEVAAHVPAAPRATWQVRLVPAATDLGWQVREVLPAP